MVEMAAAIVTSFLLGMYCQTMTTTTMEHCAALLGSVTNVPAPRCDCSAVQGTNSNGQALVQDTATDMCRKAALGCEPVPEKEQQLLQTEIEAYEKSPKFQRKIDQVISKEIAGQHLGVLQYLKQNILQESYTSFLDLGAAPGIVLQAVDDYYESKGWAVSRAVGVELVPGWVRFAQNYPRFQQRNIEFYQGDTTDFSLPPNPSKKDTFDVVMLNDVLEHVLPSRLVCAANLLKRMTHPGSVVYIHNPSPQVQQSNQGGNEQFFENTVEPDTLVSIMADAGFELFMFEPDVETRCGNKKLSNDLPLVVRSSQCSAAGWVKYQHIVFFRKTRR